MSSREALGRLLLGDERSTVQAIERELIERRAALGQMSEPEIDEDDPRALLAFLLEMARFELAFAAPQEPQGPEEPEHLRADLSRRLARRPREEVDHAQLFVDLDSTIRRARLVSEALPERGSCLAVGDDDALSLALLALRPDARIVAVDIDESLLGFLEAEARDMGGAVRTHLVDVHEDEPPGELLDAFAVVVTDPPRSFDEALTFLAYSARCLAPRPESRLFYADHPAWNPELDRVLTALPGLGLEVARVHESAARYPLTSSWVPDLPARAKALGVTAAWLRELIEIVPAHSDLHELRNRRQTSGE